MDTHVGNFNLAGSRHLHFMSLYRSHRLYTWSTAGQLSNHCLRYYSRDLERATLFSPFAVKQFVPLSSTLNRLFYRCLNYALTHVFPNFDKINERMKRKIKNKNDYRSVFLKNLSLIAQNVYAKPFGKYCTFDLFSIVSNQTLIKTDLLVLEKMNQKIRYFSIKIKLNCASF